MAKVNQMIINDIEILNTNKKFNWSKFKNQPTTLSIIVEHNHDTEFYLQNEISSKFELEENRVAGLIEKIEKFAFKTDLIMGGGGTTGNKIHNYNLSTEVTSELSTTLTNSPINSPGISSISYGFFFKFK